MSRMVDSSHERIAHKQLDRPVASKKLHALRRHPADVRNVAYFVPLGSEEKAVGYVVFAVEDGKGRDFQPSHLRNTNKAVAEQSLKDPVCRDIFSRITSCSKTIYCTRKLYY